MSRRCCSASLVHGPLRDPEGFNFPRVAHVQRAAIVPIIIEGTRLHIGFLVALAVAVVAWVLMART